MKFRDLNLDRLAQKVQEGTPQCPEAAKDFFLKLNTENAPFKQVFSLYGIMYKVNTPV